MHCNRAGSGHKEIVKMNMAGFWCNVYRVFDLILKCIVVIVSLWCSFIFIIIAFCENYTTTEPVCKSYKNEVTMIVFEMNKEKNGKPLQFPSIFFLPFLSCLKSLLCMFMTHNCPFNIWKMESKKPWCGKMETIYAKRML